MSELYNRIENLCKGANISITTMCKNAKVSRASLSDLKMGRNQGLSTDTLTKIAKTLGVSIGFLIGHEPEWEAAIDKFGFCWDYMYREDKKADARAIVNDESYLLNHRIDAQIEVFKALFSRSLENSGYSLAHPTFPDYVAMILNQGEGHHTIPVELYPELVRQYGKMPGITKGTYFQQESIEQEEKPFINDDEELTEYVQMLKTRPECRMLFQLSKNATKEDVEAAVRIIEALRKK